MTQHEDPASEVLGAVIAAPAAPPSQLSEAVLGAVLGDRYRVDSFLSQGATARVYLARDLATDGEVVVKVLSPEAAGEPGLRACVEREARVAARVRHPNVVTVLGEGMTAWGLPFVVMEALPGEPLDVLLGKHGRFEPAAALKIAFETGLALAAAHAAGVVHRDVKPGNLLVQLEGDEPRVKLLDFGMALLSPEDEPVDGAHTVLGTIEYMAPEQILVESVDARADVYALGVVLFRLVTGHLPFESDVGPMVLRHQLFSLVPPPSWLDESLDPEIEAVILNATRKHPDNRYPSMEAFVADLAALLDRSGHEVATRALVQKPDMYVPTTERGREALRVLSQKFGRYASMPPLS